MSEELYCRRNMVLGVINGILFNLAGAFVHSGTLIPLFVAGMTDSKILIGLFSTIESFGWYFPQLLSGAIVSSRVKTLWLYNRMAVFRIFCFAGIVALTLFMGDDRPTILLGGFGILFIAYSISGGMAGVPFMEIVGQTIPINKRGTFFGLRMFFGGLLAVLAGPIAKHVIDTYDYPTDFGVLFSMAFVCITLGLASFSIAKEYPRPIATADKKVLDNLRAGLALWRNDINIRKLVISRVLSFFYLMAMPFYVIVATDKLGISKAMAATYLSFEMVGYLGLNFLWAWLSNYISNKQVMRWATICSFVAPSIAIISLYANPGYFIFGLAFFFNGAAVAGSGMGFLNYLLEIADIKNRPISIGLVHSLIAPGALISVAGGLVIELFGMTAMFATTLACLIISYIYVGQLREPARAQH